MPSPRPVTPHIEADPILCSEFREGRGYTNWRPRGSGDWLLIFTLAGAGRVVAAGVPQRLLAGDAVLFAPGAVQDYSTDPKVGQWHLRWVHFQPRPHWRQWLLWPELAPLTRKVALRGVAAAELAAVLQRMLVARRLDGDRECALAMNALEEALIRCAQSIPAPSRGDLDERVSRAVRYLATHPGEPFSLERLAAHCGLSASRLGHLFRDQLDASPRSYSEKIRLDFAQDLLRQTNLSVTEVAAEVGFDDPLYFSRRYRRMFGRAPGLAREFSRARVR